MKKNIITAVLTAVLALTFIYALDAWYQSVPWYMTDIEIYMLIMTCIAVANLVSNYIVSKFKKKEQEVKVNWLTVDED